MFTSAIGNRRTRRGFTLIELLVVIAIIAILAAILFPIFTSARARAKDTTCVNNVKQLMTSIQTYCSDNNGRLPGVQNPSSGYWDDYKQQIFNYVKNENIFICPSDKTQGIQTSYAINWRFCQTLLDSPVCYKFSGDYYQGCGRTINTSDMNYYHYLLLEMPGSEDSRIRYNHRGGRPFGYMNGSVKWRKDELRHGTSYTQEQHASFHGIKL